MARTSLRMARRALSAVAAELPASVASVRTTLTYVIYLCLFLLAPYVGHGIRSLFLHV